MVVELIVYIVDFILHIGFYEICCIFVIIVLFFIANEIELWLFMSKYTSKIHSVLNRCLLVKK